MNNLSSPKISPSVRQRTLCHLVVTPCRARVGGRHVAAHLRWRQEGKGRLQDRRGENQYSDWKARSLKPKTSCTGRGQSTNPRSLGASSRACKQNAPNRETAPRPTGTC